MNAEIRIGSSLEFERARRHWEPNNSPVHEKVAASLIPHFAPREIDLLRELVRGDGGDENKEIAFRLGITEGTVKVYFHKLQTKLTLKSRTALALYVERTGIFTDTGKVAPRAFKLASPVKREETHPPAHPASAAGTS